MPIQIILSEFDLAMKLGPGKGIDPAILERAQQAMDAMGDSYREWALKDIEALHEAAAAARDDPSAPDAVQRVRDIAHNIRGQGSSFGFPLVTRVATSLYQLLHKQPSLSSPYFSVIEAHVDALRAMILQGIKRDGDAVSQQLVAGLEAMAARLLAQPR